MRHWGHGILTRSGRERGVSGVGGRLDGGGVLQHSFLLLEYLVKAEGRKWICNRNSTNILIALYLNQEFTRIV